MFAKSNLSKMLKRFAPQQGDGAATTPSDMIMRLRQMMGGQQMGSRGVTDNRIDSGNFGRPMQPPMAYRGGSSNFNESTGVYTPDAQGIGGMLSRFAQQFRNAETMPNTRPGILGGMHPRQLTPEEAMAITSMPRVSQPYQEEVVVPPRPMGPLSMPQDPGFNINTATNTFFKALGDRVASGQMTLDQARAAQAEMRALQLNPAVANRAAATEIAQRNLGVGQYAPRPQGLTLSNVPQQQSLGMAMQAPMMQPAPQGLTLSNVPQQGMAPQPAAAPQGMAMGGLMAKYYGGAC